VTGDPAELTLVDLLPLLDRRALSARELVEAHPAGAGLSRARRLDRRGSRDNAPVAEALEVRPGLLLPADELVERFSRSSGPGGQSVNTTDSRVELRFDVAGSRALPASVKDRLQRRLAARLVDGAIVVVASEHRSQLRNREAARARLAALLRSALVPPPPNSGWPPSAAGPR
jgi:ribosome-associated protein